MPPVIFGSHGSNVVLHKNVVIRLLFCEEVIADVGSLSSLIGHIVLGESVKYQTIVEELDAKWIEASMNKKRKSAVRKERQRVSKGQ